MPPTQDTERSRGGSFLPINQAFVDSLIRLKEGANLTWEQLDVKRTTVNGWQKKLKKGPCSAESEVLARICRQVHHHLGKGPRDLRLPKETYEWLERYGRLNDSQISPVTTPPA